MREISVLNLEDCESDSELIYRLVKKGGFSPQWCRVETRLAFEKAIFEQDWDLIISDYSLPEMTGVDALEIRNESEKDIPFIIISGEIDQDTAVRAMRLGAADYIFKDDLARLVPAIRRELKEAENRREKREAEKALAENEERLQMALAAAGMGAWEWDLETNEVFWSPECSIIFGTTIAGAKVDYLASLIHEEDRNWVSAKYAQAMRSRSRFSIRFRLKRKSGEIVWVSQDGKCEFDRNGKPVRMSGTLRDISKAKKAEDALLEAEEKYRIIAETAYDAILAVDTSGAITFANPAAERVFGYPRAKLVGMKLWELMPDDVAAEMQKKLERYLETGIRTFDWQNLQSKGLRCDGSIIEINVSLSEFKSADKHVFTTIVRDITEQKRSADALRRSEQNFRALVEATTEYVWELDERGNLTQFPQWWVDLTGQGFAESLDYRWLTCLHPNDRERVRASFEYALATATPISIEFQIRDRNGYYRHFAARGIPIKSRNHRPRWICALTDITHQRAAEEMLRESEERYRLISSITSDYMFASRVDDGREVEITWIAGAFERITGYSQQEFKEHGGRRAIVHPDDIAIYERDLERLAMNKPVDSEIRIIRKDGETIWVRVLAQPIWDETANHLVGIRGAVQDITVRKTAELAVRESEQRLRTIFDAVPECVKLLGKRGEIIDINPSGLAILEAEKKELVLGKTAKGILLDEHVEPFRNAIKQVLAGRDVQLTYEITGLKGTRRWLEMYAVPMRNASGEITAVLGVSRDITEKRRLESFLIASQKQYSSLINTIEGIVWEADAETFCFTFVSDQAKKLLGYPRENWFEPGFWENHIHPDDRKWAVDYCAGATARGEPHSFEYRMIASDGRIVWLRDIVSVITEPDGRKMLRGLMVDITERRNAEAARRDSEESYRELIENANDLIYTHDLQGNFLSLNRAGQRITGYSEEEARKLNIADVVSPEFLPTAAEMIDRKLKGSPPTIYSTEIISKDGRRIPLEVNTRLVYKDGVPVAVQGIGRDISERLAAEEALRQSEEQLRQAQKLESIGLLAGGVAHDFNNMLTAINGYSDLLLRKLPADDPLRAHVEEIRKAGERSAELTRQLLAFSRRQIMRPQIIDLNAAVADSARMLRRLIGENIALLTDLAPSLPKIEIDPGQLVQVLVNLVVNARDAMPDGGTIIIETRVETIDEKYTSRHVGIQPGRYIVLSVTDNGIGMDARTRERIFEPFFTTKGVGRGTGLGLSTVYGIVKQSGGSIWVYSEPNSGSTFKIFLPTLNVESIHRSGEPNQAQLPLGSERILLVEDEDSVRMLGKEILTACGYDVIDAADGAQALQLALNAENPIDLVITDVVMPQMGGRELVERLLAANPQIRVLFTSGYTDDAILRNGIVDKCADFLQKPFTFEKLARKVRELLEKYPVGN
ncbi:MAG: hypothetical protein C4324_04970 [Blastocatellia bacterium]